MKNLVKTMEMAQLDRYIQMGKYEEACKAEWLERYGEEYPFIAKLEVKT